MPETVVQRENSTTNEMTWYWLDFLKHQQYQWRLWAVNIHSLSTVYRFMDLVSISDILLSLLVSAC